VNHYCRKRESEDSYTVKAMATATERLKQWLRNAEVMERQTKAMLEALAEHIENYPDVEAYTKRLLRETREQAATLQDYLATQRSQDASTSEETVGQPGATEQCLSGPFVGTEAVRRTMTEVSGYNILIASIADATEDDELRAVCEAILRREEAMAEWLKQYLVSATREYIDGDQSPA
jgi:ferritin-like metal-binding protein YciE